MARYPLPHSQQVAQEQSHLPTENHHWMSLRHWEIHSSLSNMEF